MRVRGMIFDFNGVLINDEPIHCFGFQQALKEENLELTVEQYYQEYLPYDDYSFFTRFLSERGRQPSDEKIRRLTKLKSYHYFKSMEGSVPVIEPSLDFVRALPSEIHLAIASGAARQEIEFILSKLKLRERFAGIVAAQDVVNGKPHPDAFLKALRILQDRDCDLTPAQVLVFEDSYRGVESAHRAGMKCVALTTAYAAARLADADLVLDSLQGWTMARLEQALA